MATAAADCREQAEARRMLAAVDVSPYRLARRDRPVRFVDVVHGGATFTELFELLRAWIDEDRQARFST